MRLTEEVKKYCGILPYFGSASYLYEEKPMGLDISPATRQSYINASLYCFQIRKYCEAIRDDFLLFTMDKKSHKNKLEDLLKALLKNGLKFHQRSVNYLRKRYNIWGILFL